MVDVYIKNNSVVCSFAQRVDTLNFKKIEDKISIFMPGAKKVTFDLKNTEYVSSAFLKLIIMTVKKVGQNKFFIINVKNPSVQKVLRISGFYKSISITE